MRIGVVGYGTGGQHFHTPFIAAAKGCTLAGIVARAPDTVARARADWPGTPIFASLTEMIAAGVCDAVTITTPPQTRRSLVLEGKGCADYLHFGNVRLCPAFAGCVKLRAIGKQKLEKKSVRP